MTAQRVPDQRALAPRLLRVLGYEYRMQVRRPTNWVITLVLALIPVLAPGAASPVHLPLGTSLPRLIGSWAELMTFLAAVGVGVALADRARRERRLGLTDLLSSTSTGGRVRWWGKVGGASAAAITPVALVWAAIVTYLVISGGSLLVIPIGIGAFTAVILPGLILVASFSLAVPNLTGAPLYRVLFVGYWFWGNLLPATDHIPTLAGSPLEAVGEYPGGGWFGAQLPDAASRGIHHISPLVAAGSVGLVLSLSAIALVLGGITFQRSNP